MSKVVVQSRISPELKVEAEQVLSGLGLTTAEAIRLFLQQTVNSYSLPFIPELRKPSAGFKSAIKELDEGNAQFFNDVDEFIDSWENDK